MDRCTGHCCRSFYLGLPPEDVAAEQAKLAAGGVSRYIGVEGVLEHIRFLEPAEGGGWYACGLVTPEGNCSIYDRRPSMCSGYPNGHECKTPGCTWLAVAELPAERLFGIRLPVNPETAGGRT